MTDKQKQHLLGYLGCYTGAADGVWGPLSREATREFQRQYGLEPDGVFGAETEKRIREIIASGEAPVRREQPEDIPAWWREIRHFTRNEFRCPCGRCGGFPAEPEEALVRLAQRVREHFDAPVVVTSGVRCDAHNAQVGGVANSLHRVGKAMDFRAAGKTAAQVLAYVRTLPVHYAYAIDETHVHMDIE